MMRFLEGKSYLFHVAAWLIFLFFPFFASPINLLKDQAIYNNFIIFHCVNILILISIFYLNLFHFTPILLQERRLGLFIIGFFMGLFLYIIINIYVGHLLFSKVDLAQHATKNNQSFGSKQLREGLKFTRIVAPLFSYFFVILISSLIGLVKDRATIKLLQQQTILEKTEAELAVLKLQISPHFLFNTLNNIRWLARTKSDKTEDSIVKLSELLRYMIYNVTDKKVPLKQEMEHLQNYIELQKLRLSKSENVRYSFNPKLNSILIEPLLFIPFVENAFKYGIDTTHEPEINISLNSTEKGLIFECKNKIFQQNNSEDSGIGIANVKQRLSILYENKHTIQIENDLEYFHVKIELNHLT
ncbi:MAG: histidine kinase [Bacteroidota bacterium]